MGVGTVVRLRVSCSGVLTVDRVPLVLILALGQLHDLAQAPASQSGLGILSQLVTSCSLLSTGSRSELVPPVVAPVWV